MTPGEQMTLTAVAQAFCSARGLSFSRAAGHGAFKATFRVLHPDGRILALKVYLPGAVTQRAYREIEALTELSKTAHPSLPSFLALVGHDHGGTSYVISAEEFLGGGSLGERLARDGLCDRQEVVDLAVQVASALAEVAGAGLVHRDIKPDNLVFRDDGTIVLVDFGLVRNLALHSLTQTWLAQGPGTPLYAAAEQLNNDKHLIDWRTDQFSLGVSLAFAAYGHHPYEHPGDNADVVVGRVAAREQPAPDFLGWTTSVGLAPLVQMVQPWTASRYRRPADLIAAWAAV